MTYILNTNNTMDIDITTDIDIADTITVTGSDYIIDDSTSTITLTSGGYSNYVYTTGTATNWASPNTNFNDGNTAVMSIPHGSKTVEITKSATLDVKGNVLINGVDLEERLKTIEQVLQIPTRDATIEAKHPKLKALYEQYMHELEKYKTWDRLTGEEDGTT